jgi:predicted phage tail protein
MAVTVKIGQRLSERAGRKTSFTVDGGTVREVIDRIDALHPGFSEQILNGPYVLDWIRISGLDGRWLTYADQQIADGTVVSISMNLAGG